MYPLRTYFSFLSAGEGVRKGRGRGLEIELGTLQ